MGEAVMDVVVVGEGTDSGAAQSGEKRPVENVGVDEEGGSQLSKKAKSNGELDRELKRVATIVLALSTMATIRAGKKPSEAEVGLMMEARAKLAEICEDFAPKDIIDKDGIVAVIDDLGLNGKDKDQMLGFRGPRMTIVEKLSQAKRKMEESKKFVGPTAAYTSHPLPTSFSITAENRGIPPTLRTFPADKPSHVQISSVGVPTSLPSGLVSATISTSSQLYICSNEGKSSVVPGGFTVNHQGRNPPSVPRSDRTPNGTYLSHTQASTPAWPVQMQSLSSSKTGSEQKLANNISSTAQGASDVSMSRLAPQAARDQSLRPLGTQTVPGNLPGLHHTLQGVNFVQPPSLLNNHSEIARIVQKLLQLQLPDHPTWTPPSRDYMNKPVTCQSCQIAITDVDSVLVCDACEKGYHLKCVQSLTQRGIPRGEWHCRRCLALSNGKPLPPKYGRVMRSNPPPKVTTNPIGVPSSPEKRGGIIDAKINQQEAEGHAGHDMQTPQATRVGSDCVESISVSKTLNAITMDGKIFSDTKDVGEQINSVTSPNNLGELLEPGCSFPSVAFSSETSAQHVKNSDPPNEGERLSVFNTELPSKLPDRVSEKCDDLQTADNPCNFNGTKQSHCPEILSEKCHNDQCSVEDPEKVNLTGSSEGAEKVNLTGSSEGDEKVNMTGSSEDTLIHTIKQDGKEIPHASSVGGESSVFSSDGLHGVEWMGNADVAEGKTFYQSCTIGGVTYKVGDHALFHSTNGKLTPSKLQSMWEDSDARSKSVTIYRCYFPDELPEKVARPCLPESNEVYESNQVSTVMAGLIQGPCQVLSLPKFEEENERQKQFGFEINNGVHPVFLCKWFYDELTGQFQSVTS